MTRMVKTEQKQEDAREQKMSDDLAQRINRTTN